MVLLSYKALYEMAKVLSMLPSLFHICLVILGS